MASFCLRPIQSLYFFFSSRGSQLHAPRPTATAAILLWEGEKTPTCVFQTVSFLFKARIQPEAFYLIWSLILFACNVVISTCILRPDNPINKHRDLQPLFPLIPLNVNPFIWRHGDCVWLGCGQTVSWHEMLPNENLQKKTQQHSSEDS